MFGYLGAAVLIFGRVVVSSCSASVLYTLVPTLSVKEIILRGMRRTISYKDVAMDDFHTSGESH